MFIGIAINKAEKDFVCREEEIIADEEVYLHAQHIEKILVGEGHKVKIYPVGEETFEIWRKERPALVFNLCEAIRCENRLEACVPAMLDILNIPYTGSNTLTIATCDNKFRVKQLLKYYKLPTPHFKLLNTPKDPIPYTLKFPLIVKPAFTHNSIGITLDAVSRNRAELRNRVEKLFSLYKQPLIVEEFILGREVAVGILGNENPRTFMVEKIFKKPELNPYNINSFEVKWALAEDMIEMVKPKLPEKLARDINLAVLKAYHALEIQDYGRMDVRIDKAGNAFIIDCNHNPSIGGPEIGVTMSVGAELNGISYKEMILTIMDEALKMEEKEAVTLKAPL